MQKTLCGATRLTRSFNLAPVLRQYFSTARLSWMNSYKVLGVDRNSSDEQIRAAYIALSKIYHPDNDPSNPDLPSRFIEIKEAYDALGTIQRRRSYEAMIRSNDAMNYNMMRTQQYQHFARNSRDHGHHWKPEREGDVSDTVWKLSLRGRTFNVRPFALWATLFIVLLSWLVLTLIIYLLLLIF